MLVSALQHNTLPVIFKSELPAKIGLLPLTAKSGDEVSRALNGFLFLQKQNILSTKTDLVS